MSSTPNTPGEDTHYVETSSSLPRWVTLLFVVAFALVAYLLYAGYADRQAARKGMDDAERKTQALVRFKVGIPCASAAEKLQSLPSARRHSRSLRRPVPPR